MPILLAGCFSTIVTLGVANLKDTPLRHHEHIVLAIAAAILFAYGIHLLVRSLRT